MRRATHLFTLAAAVVLASSAVTAQACDRGKSASAAACDTKSCPASACAAHGKAAVHATTAARGTTAAKKASATRNASASAPKKSAPSTAGMRAYRDPETGTFMAPPQVEAIDQDGVAVVKDRPITLTEVSIPGGGYYVDLQGTGEDYATMKIDAKGHRVFTCAPARVAKKSATTPAATSSAFPEK